MRAFLVASAIVLAAIEPAVAQQPLVVKDRAAVILNPVKPANTADFEAGVEQLRAVLAATSDPVRKQQAQGWRTYRAEEPMGSNVLYVFVLDPAVPGADYSFKSILEESLPAAAAETAVKRLAGSLGGVQSVISMRAASLPETASPSAAARPARLTATAKLEGGVTGTVQGRLLKSAGKGTRYAWTVTLVNGGPAAAAISFTVEFRDRGGKVVAASPANRRTIAPGQKLPVSGSTPIDTGAPIDRIHLVLGRTKSGVQEEVPKEIRSSRGSSKGDQEFKRNAQRRSRVQEKPW